MTLRFLLFFLFAGLSALAENITILGINDIHAALEQMPKLYTAVQQERAAAPELLLLSAGDNRTGNPLSDMDDEPGMPMVRLMNKIGFCASAIGNHEMDAGQDCFRACLKASRFPYLCANAEPEPSLDLPMPPTAIFDIKGVKVGVLGLVHVNEMGHPDGLGDNYKGIVFHDPYETAKRCLPLLKGCDVIVVLTHLGFEEDKKLAAILPEADVIIGGHSHTKAPDDTIVNGVLITQAGRKARCLTRITLNVQDGKVTEKHSRLVSIDDRTPNPEIQAYVKHLKQNSKLNIPVARNLKDIPNREAVGCMVADAHRAATGVDAVVLNRGSVRVDTLPAGDITMLDVLHIDPYANHMVICQLTGDQLATMLRGATEDEHGAPCVSGLSYSGTIGPDHKLRLSSVTLSDGSAPDPAATYSVLISSFVLEHCGFVPDNFTPRPDLISHEVMAKGLRLLKEVDYSTARRANVTREDAGE